MKRAAADLAVRGYDYGEAMRQAGYKDHTVRKHGPYIFKEPDVIAYMEERRAELRESEEPGPELQVVEQKAAVAVHDAAQSLTESFLRLGQHIPEAIEVQVGLMNDPKVAAATRERAARTIIDTGRGLVVAAMPKKVSFDITLREAWDKAQKRVARGETIDIVADPSE